MNYSKIPTMGKFTNVASTIDDNFNKTSVEIEKLKNSTTRNKGYFTTESELKSAYPTASDGDIAYVGSNYPYQIWKWDGTAWVNSGETGGDTRVSLATVVHIGDPDNDTLPEMPDTTTADYSEKALYDWDGNDLRKYSYGTGVLDYTEFSPTKIYTAGDTVSYLNKLYTFNMNHSGEWTGNDVYETNIKKIIDNQIYNLKKEKIFLSQEEYDSIEPEEDKLYFIYEE